MFPLSDFIQSHVFKHNTHHTDSRVFPRLLAPQLHHGGTHALVSLRVGLNLVDLNPYTSIPPQACVFSSTGNCQWVKPFEEARIKDSMNPWKLVGKTSK